MFGLFGGSKKKEEEKKADVPEFQGFPTYMEQFPPASNVDPTNQWLMAVPAPHGSEYLSMDDIPGTPRRSWGDRLFFELGFMYLAGVSVGAAQGAYRGWSESRGMPHLKLRVNSVLNATGRTGVRLGNRFGMLVLAYTMIYKLTSKARGVDEDDPINMVAAGALTGMVYQSPAGFFPAMAAAFLGSSVASVGALGVWKKKHGRK